MNLVELVRTVVETFGEESEEANELLRVVTQGHDIEENFGILHRTVVAGCRFCREGADRPVFGGAEGGSVGWHHWTEGELLPCVAPAVYWDAVSRIEVKRNLEAVFSLGEFERSLVNEERLRRERGR